MDTTTYEIEYRNGWPVDLCSKCDGKGRLNWTSVDSARCWRCGTRGYFAAKAVQALMDQAQGADAETVAQLQAQAVVVYTKALQRREYEAARRAAKAQAAQEAYMAQAAVREAEKAAQEAAEAAAEEARRAACTPVPTGRQLVAGTVLGVKKQEAYVAWGSASYKMLVQDDRGFKVWGTVPLSMEGDWGFDTLRGMRVEFTATLQRSDDDELFGFYSRPAKASAKA